MAYPAPRAGQIIRYAYLWEREARRGADEATKDRPCAVLLAIEDRLGGTVATVLPITHTPPRDPGLALEIPAATKRRLGLDGERSWVILGELNRFVWPGPDLRSVPGSDPDTILYGELPATFYRTLRDRWLALFDLNHVRDVKRTE